jgi:hypothetical protein
MNEVALVLQLAVAAMALLIYGVTYFLDRRTALPAVEDPKDNRPRGLAGRRREVL